MRAYRIIGAERAELCEIERPALRPDEVMIRVGAAGICHTDIELAAAAAFLGSKLPLTAGHEIAGWVDEIGSDVSGLRLGDPVAVYEMVGCGRCRECLGGRDHVCAVQTEVIGVTRDGGLAENVAVPHRNAFKIADLDVVTASVLTDAGLTAYAAVGHAIDLLRPGATALVIGVGGVGHLAIQCVAALTSARIIAMDVDDDRLDLARRLGAHDAVLSSDSTADDIRQLVGPPGVDAVLDFVANDATIAVGGAVVRMGGAIVLTGIGHSTFTLTTGFDSPVQPEVRVVRTLGGSRTDLCDVIRLARDGRITAVATTRPLEETSTAMEQLAAGAVVGRTVIVP